LPGCSIAPLPIACVVLAAVSLYQVLPYCCAAVVVSLCRCLFRIVLFCSWLCRCSAVAVLLPAAPVPTVLLPCCCVLLCLLLCCSGCSAHYASCRAAVFVVLLYHKPAISCVALRYVVVLMYCC
jgi:hypothetical protein